MQVTWKVNVVPGVYPPSLPAPVTALVSWNEPVTCWIELVTVTASGRVAEDTTTSCPGE